MLTSSKPARARQTAPAAPRVTFITPAYNAIATLDQTIASVCAQTCPDWEMFVIDDGSKDETYARAQAWAARDGRIHALTKANGGPASARNLGIGLARGAWLAFLDSDDWLRPTFVERMLREADRTDDCGLVICAYDTVTADGQRLQTHWARDLSDPFPVFARMCPVAPVGLMVRADLIRTLGGFDERLIGSEDWDMWQRVARMGVRFASVREPHAYYRLLPNSLSRKAQRLVVDGMSIIDRGFTRDERRPDADDPYADGCDPDFLLDAKAHYGLFIATVAAGGDLDPADILAHAPDMRGWTFDPGAWGGVIVDALAYAMTLDRGALAARWAEVAPKLERLLAVLRDKMGPGRQVDLLRVHAYAQAVGLEAARAVAPHDIIVAALDIGAPLKPIAAPDDAVLVVGIQARGRSLSWRTALPCEVSTEDALRTWMRAQALHLPTREAVLAAGALKNPRFWLHAAADAAAPDAIGGLVASDARASLVQRVKRTALTAGGRGLAAALAGAPPTRMPRPFRPARILPVLRIRGFAGPEARGPERYQLEAETVRVLLAALKNRGYASVDLAAAANAQRAWSAPRHGAFALAIDGDAIAPQSPLFALLREAGFGGTVFLSSKAMQGEWSRAKRNALRNQGFSVGLACSADDRLSRRTPRETQAHFAAALAALGAEGAACGVHFAIGDVDDVIRRSAHAAGFAFGLGPVSGFANLSDDPMDWNAFDALARESVDLLLQKIEPTLP